MTAPLPPGVENVMRAWQAADPDGAEKYPDSVCLGGLYHSIYGTEGYQAFRFPPEKRDQLRALIGERGAASPGGSRGALIATLLGVDMAPHVHFPAGPPPPPPLGELAAFYTCVRGGASWYNMVRQIPHCFCCSLFSLRCLCYS